jgi:hypothetical protein
VLILLPSLKNTWRLLNVHFNLGCSSKSTCARDEDGEITDFITLKKNSSVKASVVTEEISPFT